MTSALRYDASHGIRWVRSLVLVGVLTALVAGAVITGESTLRSSYPFLDGGPLRAPDILYLPTYFPPATYPLGWDVGPKGAGTDLEMRMAVPSGPLTVWESTRANATVEEAAGEYQKDGEVHGVLGTWSIGSRPDGSRLLHARIGQTLVVISAPLSVEELLQIANSMRKGSSRELILSSAATG